ncbi:MAG: helix-turn-helix transcriptional regulator [Clostridia bacterium]|nr:helix-turn-helix transcriptional regulator [Clostridia bacterium]
MKQKVAENIKRLRIERKITQSELAALLSVSPQAVSRWENGLAYPDIEIFPKLADYFGVTVDEMMGRTVPIIARLSERITQLTYEYYRNGGNDASILPELCDLLEKATEIAPLQYSQSYFKFAKFLQKHTSNDHHINHARAVAHSVLGDTNSIYLTTLLRDIILHEDEDKLEQWKKHITDSKSFSTWQIPKEKAYELRKKFIDAFVDTSHDLYVRYIRDLRADDIMQAEGLIVSHLWSCLKKSNAEIVDFYDAMCYLNQRQNEKVFVMWDIRPEKVIYPQSWSAYRTYTPPCEILFKSDEIISIEPKELCEVLLHDHHMVEDQIVDMSRYFLREDVYVFDETCTWYIALTHEEHNNKRLCLSNIQELNTWVL